jgi:hypothetical protein
VTGKKQREDLAADLREMKADEPAKAGLLSFEYETVRP